MRDKIGTSSGPDRDQRPKLFSGEIHPSEAHGSDGMLTNVGSMFSQCCCYCCLRDEKRNRSLSPPHHHQYFGAMPFYCPNIDPLNWVTIFVTTFFIELCYWARGFTRCWLFFFLFPTPRLQHAQRHLTRSQPVADQFRARATFWILRQNGLVRNTHY